MADAGTKETSEGTTEASGGTYKETYKITCNDYKRKRTFGEAQG